MAFSGLHPGLTQEPRIGPIAEEIFGISGSVETYDLLPDAATLEEGVIYVVRLDGTGPTAAPNGNGLYWAQSGAWAFLDNLNLQDSNEVENKSGVTGATVTLALNTLNGAAPAAHDFAGAEHNADTLADVNSKITDATLIDTGDSRLSDARTPTGHGGTHTDGTDDVADMVGDAGSGGTHGLVPAPGSGDAVNFLKGDGTWAAPSVLPAAHNLAGAQHNADTLANLNIKISDATLIDTGDSRLSDARTPTSHNLAGSEHAADTLANLNGKISDATLIDTGDSRLSDARTPTAHASDHTDGTDDVADLVGDSGSGGTHGLVPAPAAGDAAANKYLKADGVWTALAGGGLTEKQLSPDGYDYYILQDGSGDYTDVDTGLTAIIGLGAGYSKVYIGAGTWAVDWDTNWTSGVAMTIHGAGQSKTRLDFDKSSSVDFGRDLASTGIYELAYMTISTDGADSHSIVISHGNTNLLPTPATLSDGTPAVASMHDCTVIVTDTSATDAEIRLVYASMTSCKIVSDTGGNVGIGIVFSEYGRFQDCELRCSASAADAGLVYVQRRTTFSGCSFYGNGTGGTSPGWLAATAGGSVASRTSFVGCNFMSATNQYALLIDANNCFVGSCNFVDMPTATAIGGTGSGLIKSRNLYSDATDAA